MYITRRHRKTQTEVLDNWFGKNKPTLPFNLGAIQSVFKPNKFLRTDTEILLAYLPLKGHFLSGHDDIYTITGAL